MNRRATVLALLATSTAFVLQAVAQTTQTEPGTLLYQQALAAEKDEKGPEAVRLYTRASRAGSGKAAARLSQIYETGIPGVLRDHGESLKWDNAARVLDKERAGGWGCPPKC